MSLSRSLFASGGRFQKAGSPSSDARSHRPFSLPPSLCTPLLVISPDRTQPSVALDRHQLTAVDRGHRRGQFSPQRNPDASVVVRRKVTVMDHFLSGLDAGPSPWYASRPPVSSHAHEFAIGTSSFQLIPITGSNNHTPSSHTSYSTSNTLNSHSAFRSPADPKVKSEVKDDDDSRESKSPTPSVALTPLSTNMAHHSHKAKNSERWDTKKVCNICGKVLSRGGITLPGGLTLPPSITLPGGSSIPGNHGIPGGLTIPSSSSIPGLASHPSSLLSGSSLLGGLHGISGSNAS
ncbi:hypothetical protein C7M84_004384 [Penaeus vannamei]|uniref:Uncharacterized protein n=1 Tax=Penaeus vannamei TaxID=6689 RepID=A0A3R7P6Q2_PENVA|nr:hypothetical protein C7M84_004384 [Penaeus vannamei]